MAVHTSVHTICQSARTIYSAAIQQLSSRPPMTKPGQRQRVTVHKVEPARVSPDDVRWREIERDRRLEADQRSDLEKHFGDPDYSRSALAQYRQRQAARRAQPASGDIAATPSAPRATRAHR